MNGSITSYDIYTTACSLTAIRTWMGERLIGQKTGPSTRKPHERDSHKRVVTILLRRGNCSWRWRASSRPEPGGQPGSPCPRGCSLAPKLACLPYEQVVERLQAQLGPPQDWAAIGQQATDAHASWEQYTQAVWRSFFRWNTASSSL